MQVLRVKTRAKVNLHLEVLGRRQDGFHEIETIFQTVDLADAMELEPTRDGRVEITCDDPSIPCDETNICHRAVVAMRRFAGPTLGARIHLDKRIPAGAGLGGGSANAAGVILAVRKGLGLEVTEAHLQRLAAGLGSDVPFMLHGGTMLGRGRGERLTPLTGIGRAWFVIVKPAVSISTAWVYSNLSFRLTPDRTRISLKAANSVLARIPGVHTPFRNVLEAVVCPAHPVVAGVLDELLSLRPCLASMTGSGSALFAVFDEERRAAEVAERFSVRGFFTSVVLPAKRAVEFEASHPACGNGIRKGGVR
jgi:4-diphosphocytidyl-2-C-methyl-D-erythritol kinase